MIANHSFGNYIIQDHFLRNNIIVNKATETETRDQILKKINNR